MTGEDRAQHSREDSHARAVVEEALAVEDGLESARGTDLAEELHHSDRVRGGDDRAEQKSARPIQAEAVVGHRADQQDRQEHAHRGQQADGHDPTPHLLEVERQRRLEDEPGYEGEQDQVGPDRRQAKAPCQWTEEADQDAADRQQHGIRDGRGGARDETERGRRRPKHDQEEKKALGAAHQDGRRPPADQPSRHTSGLAVQDGAAGGILCPGPSRASPISQDQRVRLIASPRTNPFSVISKR